MPRAPAPVLRPDDSTNGPAVETRGLIKRFGETTAVDGVDLRVERGGIYGFLGPNGAGKTTVIRMLATLLRPDGGEAEVLGRDVRTCPAEIRERISLTGQFASLDEDLTGIENLVLLARLQGFGIGAARQRGAELLEAFGLTDAAARQVKKYSGGMRRRLDIAGSLLVTPELIFLDEPTTGIDPRSRNQVWEIIRTLVDAGTTVLLTTQYLEEADRLAGRLAVIDAGRVIAEGTPGQLKAQVGSGALTVRVADPAEREQAARLVGAVLGHDRVTRESDPAALSVLLPERARVSRALAELEDSGVEVESFSVGQPSLDEVFLTLTGGPHAATDEPGDRSGPADRGAPGGRGGPGDRGEPEGRDEVPATEGTR
ncbi:ATP-binding cassette domain-containing protein [Rothia sp. AR01]|uniref:ATP-binding cassette domain-containing protein n=1 Tax=Rothia santali TaxID=2949643 RepID=A0A9X2HG73_9MICC|nr:ATP-binding cassette domain-containing protein [Rothia santali]MCP3426167.1 ATP-binding cassette domain-containing protein [Rothia santali]